VGNLFVVTTAPVRERWCCLFSCVPQRKINRFGLLFGNHIVDASSLVIFLPLFGVNPF
jgi:hypothetical protein